MYVVFTSSAKSSVAHEWPLQHSVWPLFQAKPQGTSWSAPSSHSCWEHSTSMVATRSQIRFVFVLQIEVQSLSLQSLGEERKINCSECAGAITEQLNRSENSGGTQVTCTEISESPDWRQVKSYQSEGEELHFDHLKCIWNRGCIQHPHQRPWMHSI